MPRPLSQLEKDLLLKRVDKALEKQLAERPVVDRLVKNAYYRGIEGAEMALGMNFIPNKRAIRFLQNYTFDLVKGVNDDVRKTLRQELTRALLNDAGPQEVARRLREKLGIFQSRARSIARTELNRAENFGHLQAGKDAKDAGLVVKKEWFNQNPQSPICRALAGTRVGVDEQFHYDGRSYDGPPGHSNCRSRVLIVQERARN